MKSKEKRQEHAYTEPPRESSGSVGASGILNIFRRRFFTQTALFLGIAWMTLSYEIFASRDMGLVALRMHEFYKLYNVYFFFCIASLLLVKGDGSVEIRNRITLFSGALAMGLFLTLAWFLCVIKTQREGYFPVFREISMYLDSAKTMRVVGWQVIPVMGAVAFHAVNYQRAASVFRRRSPR